MVVPWLHDKSIGTVSPDGAAESGGDTPGASWTLGATHLDGAAEAGGDALSVQAAFGSPDGAAEAGGAGTRIDAIARAADGAAEAGGDAVASTRAPAIDGAAKAGGDAVPVARTMAATTIDGAAEAGGDAVSAPLRTHSAVPDGAAQAGGDGPGTPTRLATRIPDGGSKAGGDGITKGSYTFNHSADGAAIVGGAVVVSATKAGTSYSIGSTQHRGPTTQRAILNALRNHLIDQGLFIDSTIWIKIDPTADDPAPVGDQYLVISPGQKTVNQAWAAGAGVEVDIQVENIELTLYHRLALDHLQRSTHWTASASHGAYNHARNVVNALHICDLMDLANTILVAEPIRVLQLGRPMASTRKSGWGEIPIVLEVTYRTDFDSTLS